MGIFGNLGNNIQINPVNWGNIGLILLIVVVFIIAGVVTFVVVYNKFQKKQYIHRILFVKEVRGDIKLIGEDYAKELNIPYTSIKVFYLKDKKTYSPKLIYDVGKNLYIILIGKGGEWINTNLRYGKDGIIEVNDELKPTRDYANENLKELIKRNWTDKNKDWWKENAHYIFLIVLGVIIVIYLIWGGILEKKTASYEAQASLNYQKASEIYAQSNNDFKEFIKEYFKTSGTISTTPISGGG
jgi:hypothetical protein